jgi:hypothetical protein
MEDAHVAVLLEDLRSQFKVFGEALESTREVLQREIAEVSSNLRHEMGEVSSSLGRKIDDVAADVTEVKVRLSRVEERLNGAPPRSRGGRRRS